jgi:hypothetical protein
LRPGLKSYHTTWLPSRIRLSNRGSFVYEATSIEDARGPSHCSNCRGDDLRLGLADGIRAGAHQLQVYSTLEPANIAEFKRAFEQDNPDIEIVWIRDSTGVITARIVSEGDRQRGDAIWGLAVTSVAKFKTLGLLEA